MGRHPPQILGGPSPNPPLSLRPWNDRLEKEHHNRIKLNTNSKVCMNSAGAFIIQAQSLEIVVDDDDNCEEERHEEEGEKEARVTYAEWQF